jgi:hypothetical protein
MHVFLLQAALAFGATPAVAAPPMHAIRTRNRDGLRHRPRYRSAPNARTPKKRRGRRVAYRVMVEEAAGYPIEKFAAEVADVLADRRGWSGSKKVWFHQRRRAQLRIILATPPTVDRLCAPLDTNGYVSCFRNNRVVINVLRWRGGAAAWKGKLLDYRTYLLNHEVGHALGQRHRYCRQDGSPVPVMHPQTYGFMNCQANFWPLRKERGKLR